MIVELCDAQRGEFCRVLSMVAPDAPMLCSGWTALDLAAHIWILSYEPPAWAGMLLPPLSWLTDRETRWTKERFFYARLIEGIRTDPASFACMSISPREDYRYSLGEYFIHTEGMRRPNWLPEQGISPDLAETLWRRFRTASWQLHPFASQEFRTPQDGHGRIRHGPVTRQITGEPGELLMWVHRHIEAARVEIMKF